ncbi:EI24 domain-containing protein [Turneriella parva]|uniref:Uncharacterized protein n=1 Tax=Turneriella parva (strain ATCC BAA-1111 / DSM 21527 / NCTC 11395 / H) TaxID=869212 RepID=I4B7W4_TURPD|nr:EI24 domain-containing protein [Turneriella parva]AFM13371.1 protein of unknown function DUF540 [Turneriella parva DSM 21527]
MFARIARGFSAPLSSFGYMSDNKLWGFAVIPLLLTLAIVVAMAFFVWVYLLGYISDKLAFDVSDWPQFLQFLIAGLQFVMKLVIIYFFFTFLLRVFMALFSIIVIPFLSPLVEKILAKEGVTTIKISNLELIGFIFSSIVYNVKILVVQSIFALLLLFTGPLQPILNFFTSSYFVGRSYFDYVFEMLGKPREFGEMAKGYRAISVGVGMFSHVFLFVPIVGAVFTPILCVVAATRIFAESSKQQR